LRRLQHPPGIGLAFGISFPKILGWLDYSDVELVLNLLNLEIVAAGKRKFKENPSFIENGTILCEVE
jgi:hypothetical protein